MFNNQAVTYGTKARVRRSRTGSAQRLLLEALEERHLLAATGVNNLGDLGGDEASSNPLFFTDVNGMAYFCASTEQDGAELWKSDGTTGGTVPVANINPGTAPSLPRDLINVNGTLFFRAYDPENGVELWKSHGTETSMVRDIKPGPLGSGEDLAIITSKAVFDGKLFFVANDGTNGIELWKSDGTENGTEMVKNIGPDAGDSNPEELTVAGDTLYFAVNETYIWGLWKTNGTTGGTQLVKSFDGALSEFTVVGDTLFFVADDGEGNGLELWKSDGTTTTIVKDINPGVAQGSFPTYLTNVGGKLYFTADDGTHGTELWVHDPNAESNQTHIVEDIYPGNDFDDIPFSSEPKFLTNVNGALFFSADDGIKGRELWTADATAATRKTDINPGLYSSNPAGLTAVNEKLFFAADDEDSTRLWEFHPDTDDLYNYQVWVEGLKADELTNIHGTLFFQGYVPDEPTQDTLWISGRSAVAGRRLFYNQSGTGGATVRYDGNDLAINSLDDNAIATDKVAYLPDDAGPATFASVSSYSKGINGIMIDLDGPGAHEFISAADFEFWVGNNNSPSTWSPANAPTSVSVRAGDGVSGSDRIEIIWNSGAPTKEWLEVIVLANENTGLAEKEGYPAGQSDVFFFGNAIGNTGAGDTAVNSTVNAIDEGLIQNNPAVLSNNIPITNLYDINRNAIVNSVDQGIARTNATNSATVLKYLNLADPPAAPEAAPLVAASSVDGQSATGDTGLASALAVPVLSGPERAMPRWFDNRLGNIDVNWGRPTSTFQHPYDTNSPRSRALLQRFEAGEDGTALDDELLESLVLGRTSDS